MKCPHCQCLTKSNNINRHLKIHNLSAEQIDEIKKMQMGRIHKTEKTWKKCPTCQKMVIIKIFELFLVCQPLPTSHKNS